jgi:hypothetical protein
MEFAQFKCAVKFDSHFGADVLWASRIPGPTIAAIGV